MKALLAALLVAGSLAPALPQMCVGAQLAAVHAMAAKLQERKTPPGEWCQRAQTRMPKGAHACGCHKTNCQDDDPNTLPAHTDSACLNFCTVEQCACPVQDCK